LLIQSTVFTEQFFCYCRRKNYSVWFIKRMQSFSFKKFIIKDLEKR
jgi:hypothetical protein